MPSLRSEIARVRGRLAERNRDRGLGDGRGRPEWSPFPGSPQEAAYLSEATVTGYGGAAGGGKSSLQLGLALTQHHRAIIFRRELAQLRDVVMEGQELLATAADPGRFNQNLSTWRFRDGRSLELGGMQRPDDWMKYKGRPHDFIGVDEATEFLEIQVRSVIGWLRTTRPGQRCRVMLGFNPPTNADGMWIISYFAPWLDDAHPNPARPGELRWYVMIDGEEREHPDGVPFTRTAGGKAETIHPQSRTFFPAKLDDNPALRDTGYRGTLQALPEPLRSQLLNGDFKAGIREDAWQIIPAAWVDAAFARWRADGGSLPMTCLGVDVAHGGADKTVYAPRHGAWVDRLVKVPGAKTPDGRTAAAIAVKLRRDDADINVDAIGYGAPCAEKLRDPIPEGYGIRKAIPINVANGSRFRDRSGKYGMVNQRAEMWWRLREQLDPEGDVLLALPPDPELKADLCAGRYEITPSGIKVEAKDNIIARLRRSPDCGEAVALTTLKGYILWTPPN